MSRDRGDPWPPQAGAGAVLARIKAIFLMFWAVAASRHWHATAINPLKRA